MPLVSRKGILAIAAVIDVAINARSRPVSAKALAARHKLPPRHLEPVLQALVRDGILRGVRGPHGGYELAREHRRITADDILRAAGSTEDDGDPPLPNSSLVSDVVRPALGRGRARIFDCAQPHQYRRHDQARRDEITSFLGRFPLPFTIWTLSARLPAGVKSPDSRVARRTPLAFLGQVVMPETIRTANERPCSRPGRGGFLAAFAFAVLCVAFDYAGSRRRRPHRGHRGDTRTARRADADPRPGLLRDARHFGAAAHAPDRGGGAIGCARRSRHAARRNRPAQDADAVAAAGAGGMGGWHRRAGNLRRHQHRGVGRGARARAGLRRLAGAGSGATHGARGRDAARRRPRLRDDADHQRRPRRSKRKAARWRGARCCACAMSAASNSN